MSDAFRLIAVACFAFTFGTVGAQESTTGPPLTVGESWTYQMSDRQFDEGIFTIEVTERTASGYSLSAKDVTVKGLSRIPTALTMDLNWVRLSVDGPTADCWFSFPLTVGRIWACKTKWISQNGNSGEDSITWKVVGPEKITVKAGTLDTIKIVGEGRWKNNSNGNSDLSTITVWFAPDARGLVRYQRDNWPKRPANPQPRIELIRHVAVP
jgi:hypothetical protein